MSAYIFGRDFTLTFYPKDTEGNAVAPSGDSPSIYIYSERPSRDTVINEDGSTSSIVGSEITAWSGSGTGREISVTAIQDPDQDGPINTRDYYLGVRFTLKSSGQQQASIVPFEVSRALGYDVELSVTASDIEKYFPDVDSWVSDSQQNAFATEAIEEVKAELRDSGYEWALIRRPDRLRLVVIHKVLTRIALSQRASGDDGFLALYEESKSTAIAMLSSLSLEYDSSGDGEADKEVKKRSFLRVVR